MLADEQKRSRVLNAKKLLKMFRKYSKKYFNNLVTSDETWVYYFEPKSKCFNRVWATKNAVRPSIVKRLCTVKTELHGFFLQGMQGIPVPKCRTEHSIKMLF